MEGFEKNNEKTTIKRLIQIKTKKIIKKLYKPALSILTLQFIVVLYFSIDQFQNIKVRIPTILKYLSLSLDTYEIDDYKDYFNSIIFSFFNTNKLDRIDLSLSFKDKQKLECDRQRKSNCTKDGWVRSSFKWQGNEYKIKLRAKGDREFHRLSLNQMSFKVDIRGQKRFRGMEEFSMQLPALRNYTHEALVARALERNKLISPRHSYVRLYINGEYVGIRHIEEGFNRELVENAKKRYGPIFSLEENFGDVYEQAKFDLHDKKKWQESTSNLPSEALSILRASKNDPKIFNEYFDIKKWAVYMAMVDAMQVFHGSVPKSVKFYLNPSTGLIEPIFYDGHLGAGLFDNYHLSDVLKKDNALPDCRWTCPNLYFYRMMFGDFKKVNKDFFTLYIESLKKFSSEDYISNVFEKLWGDLSIVRGNIYRQVYRRDNSLGYGIAPHVGQFNRIKKRLKRIRNDINISENIIPYHSYDKTNLNLSLENKNSRFPQLYKLSCENEEVFINTVLVRNVPVTINLNLFKLCKKNELFFTLNKGEKEFALSNVVMSDLKLDKKITTQIKASKLNSETKVFKNEVIIEENIKEISKKVFFRPGSKVCIKSGKLLHITNSEVYFEGTSSKPNIFSNCNKIGGSLIIENSEINLGNIKLSNLSSPNISLRQLFGGLNIIDSYLKGNEIYIENSQSEDAINFIDSNINLKSLIFNNINSDALDSDFSKVNIENIECKKVGNDCVDLSYSSGNITSVIGNNVKDKVISLGERSILNIFEVRAEQSAIGLVSKDLSKLNIENFYHKKVKLPLAAYVKKPELGSPTIKVNKIYPNKYNLDFISEDSKVEINKKEILGKNKSINISNMLYGNFYGVKTVR